jgi:hypothetical protein
MKVLKIINTDNGWDNVMCIADSWEAAAFYLEMDSVNELKEWVKERGGEIVVSWEDIETLPEGCDTLEAAIKEHWGE